MIRPLHRLAATAAAISLVALVAATPVKIPPRLDAVLPAQSSLERSMQTVDDFDVEAGPLPQQLGRVLNKQQVDYIYSFEELEGIRGSAVHGRLSLADALGAILEGTGCSHELFAGTISILCSGRAHVRESRGPLHRD